MGEKKKQKKINKRRTIYSGIWNFSFDPQAFDSQNSQFPLHSETLHLDANVGEWRMESGEWGVESGEWRRALATRQLHN